MTRIVWNDVGARHYETGVDRGVLFVDDQPGIPWNGLSSVSETPNGGEPQPFYIDGFKYLNLSAAEEFAATLSAFSCPPEFGPCDGTKSIQNGLFVTQQPRKSFGFSYRTLIGNDIFGPDFGYKIHLVYNALAAPTSRSNNSIGESNEATALSWAITTLPPAITGYKPTSHFVVDSRNAPSDILSELEDMLYGTEDTLSSLPSVAELVELFTSS